MLDKHQFVEVMENGTKVYVNWESCDAQPHLTLKKFQTRFVKEVSWTDTRMICMVYNVHSFWGNEVAALLWYLW